MSQPLISVILAVKNGEQFLGEAIQSVLSQDYRPLELLVIDGHSTDGSAEIAAGFPGVRVEQQPHTGIVDAWNYGIELAQGEWIAFHSADDLWLPGELLRQAEALAADPEALYTVTHCRFFQQGDSLPPGFNPGLLQGSYPAHMPETLLARRSAFEVLGKWAERPGNVAHDVDWFVQARERNVPHIVLEECYLAKRLHGGSTGLNGAQASTTNMLEIVRESLLRRRKLQGAAQHG